MPRGKRDIYYFKILGFFNVVHITNLGRKRVTIMPGVEAIREGLIEAVLG